MENIQAPVWLLCQCQLELHHLDRLDFQTFVEQRYDIRALNARLVEIYRQAIAAYCE